MTVDLLQVLPRENAMKVGLTCFAVADVTTLMASGTTRSIDHVF